jgi:hypothetical protein
VRLVLERTAYISYRIGNKVHWTRRRIKLKKGETVITDGKITARTRCANRVEEVPQQATSSSEPPVVRFEEQMSPAMGTATQIPPVPFQSALLNPPAAPGVGPAPPLSLYTPFGNGNWIPISPLPLPGVCGPGKKQTGTGSGGKKGRRIRAARAAAAAARCQSPRRGAGRGRLESHRLADAPQFRSSLVDWPLFGGPRALRSILIVLGAVGAARCLPRLTRFR